MKYWKRIFLIISIVMIFLPVTTVHATTISFKNYYFLESALDKNKVVDVSGGSRNDGANIQLWEKNGSDAQLFRIARNGTGYYALINKGSNKALDVYGAGTYAGANVNQWSLNGTSAQQWKIYNASGYKDGYVRFMNRCGKYLDVSGGNIKNGTNIQIWNKNRTKAQVFKLVPYVQTSYVTVTLGSFSSVDQWKKKMQYAEQRAVGFSRLGYNLSGNLTNYGKMIIGKQVLKYKTINVTYYQYGQRKSAEIKLPSKVRFKLHKHTINQKVWFDFSYLTLTQYCTCGERSQLQWEVPYPEL